jgi:adenine C2-methylase RlmN of 23S rRNA A2503 and tRNA A37
VTAQFVEILTQGGLNVNIRYRKGERIDAACGQLRRGEKKEGLGISASPGGSVQRKCM